MKKIGIAVFALMFGGAAYLGAENVKTDFVGTDSIQYGCPAGTGSCPSGPGNWPKK